MPTFQSVGVLDLLLNRSNPRHVPKDNQEEIIAALLKDEEVYNLARHMGQNGANPLEVVAVFPDDDGNLIVAEGNRRICAAQLLTDPEKAPDSYRARFKALAENARDVSQITVAEFNDYATAQPWLQVLHDGEQDGVGRRRWKPEQKARATTAKSTNSLTVAVLDYAETRGILDASTRENILISTATRYLQNPGVRRAMGISSVATDETLKISSDQERLDRVLQDFLSKIASKELHSRSVTADWNAYAAGLEKTFGKVPASAPTTDVSSSSAGAASASRKSGRSSRIVVTDTNRIGRSQRVVEALNKLRSPKLSSLYQSMTTVRLDEHPALMTAGAWMFLETLTAAHGRGAGNDFMSYVSGKLGGWSIGKEAARPIKASLKYIQEHGNLEKHDASFTALDARNLHNHFQILEPVIAVLLEECVARKAKP